MDKIEGFTRIRTFYFVVCVCVIGGWGAAAPLSALAQGAGPEIDVWHGLSQRVGHLGYAQSDFNVLGNVSDPDGIRRLHYRVNGGEPQKLEDRKAGGNPTYNVTRWRRLAAVGDFNADIPLDSLRLGANSVEIIAEDELGNKSTVTVTVNRETGFSTLPYAVDWSDVGDPQDAGQYVDGNWTLEDTGLRIRKMGYDRIFLLGEAAWQDYEVTVPVTVNDLDTIDYVQNGVGFLMRFTGHVVGGPRNFEETQPKYGYQPFGGIGWLRWRGTPVSEGGVKGPPRRQFYLGDADEVRNFGTMPIEIGRAYVMKMRAETLPDAPNGDGVTRYSWKTWSAESPEPQDWDWAFTQTSEHALRRGGVGLLAHFADVTFGDVVITSLDTEKPVISGVETEPGETMAAITWSTGEPTRTRLAYGPTAEYGTVVEDPATATNHRVLLQDLGENTTYYYQITATDPSGNATTSSGSFATSDQGALPVELAQFGAVADKKTAHLSWQTASETSNAGFEVQHRRGQTEGFVEAGFVQGVGTTREAQHYRYRLDNLLPGTHAFRLKQIDFDGSVHYSQEVTLEIGLPTLYRLTEAYPNPFNPQTQVELTVQAAQQVRADVYDMLGRRVVVLYDGEVQAGAPTRLLFDAATLASGSYLLRVQGETFAATRRVTLLK